MFEQWLLHILAAQDMGEPLRPAEMLAMAPRYLFRQYSRSAVVGCWHVSIANGQGRYPITFGLRDLLHHGVNLTYCHYHSLHRRVPRPRWIYG